MTRNQSFIAGLGIGLVVGWLIAPRRGSDTRDYLYSKGSEASDRGREYFKRGKLERELLWTGLGGDEQTADLAGLGGDESTSD
jgi:gas vesicle protein